MKKQLLLASLLLTSLVLVSCNKEEPNSSNDTSENGNIENKPSVDTTPDIENDSVYANSIELYEASVAKMKTLTYVQEGGGTSITQTILPLPTLTIYDHLEYKPGEVYFEKMSNGDGKGQIGLSFAQKAYINGDQARRSSSSTMNVWPEENGKVNVPDEEWSKPSDSTKNDVNAEFGKKGDNYLSFNISETTVSKESLTYSKDESGYVMNFDLLIDDGINSKSIDGYKEQVKAMSNQNLKSVSYIKVGIKLDNDLRVVSYTSKESYTINLLNASVNNDLKYTFKYYENPTDLVITKF